MGMIREYYDLDIWKKAYTLSLEIHKASLQFPKHEQYALADQIQRSSKSVCANIAEGFAKQRTSKAEFKRFLLIAQGSATETHMWCQYINDLGYAEEKIAKEWQDTSRTISKMINALHAKA